MASGTWSWDLLEKALGKVVGDALGLTCVWAEQNAPRPHKPYALLSWTSPGIPVSERPERRPGGGGAGVELIVEQKTAMVSLDIFTLDTIGDGAARALIEVARLALTKQVAQDALVLVGAAVVDRGPARDLGALQGTQIEGRAQVDFRLAYALTATQTTSWIDTAAWTPNYSGG